MFKDIRSLGKESVIYGLSTVAARLLNFFLMPFYTHYLVPAEYGVAAALFSYIAFFNILYQYGMDQAYMRHFEEKEKSFPAAFAGVFWGGLVLTVLLVLAASPAAALSGIGAANGRLVVWSALILFSDALSVVPFADLRMEHKAVRYASIRFFTIVINVLLNIVFISFLRKGVEGIFLANIISSLFALAAVLLPCRRLLSLKIDGAVFRRLAVFALPLVPAGLGSMAVQVIDRPILLRLSGEAAVGIYQANYRLGIFMMLVVSMFDQAWRPFFLDRSKKENAGAVFARVLTYFVLAGVWLTLALSFFIGDLVKVKVFSTPLIHPAYWPGLGIVPIILWGYLFNGVYINFLAPVILAKKTASIMTATLSGAAVNIAANFILIPLYGITGAAWATFIAYFAMAVVIYPAGRDAYPIPYEFKRLAAMFGAGLLLSLPLLMPGLITGRAWFLYRAAALAAFPSALLAFGFFLPEEKNKARSLAAGLFKTSNA